MKNKKIIPALIISQLLLFDTTKCLDQAAAPTPIETFEVKEVAGKAAKKAGKKVLEEVFNALDFICTVGMLKSLAEDGYNVTEAIVDYSQGRTQKSIEDEQYTKKCKYLETKKKFKNCIVKNARKKVGGKGYPKECETLGKMFAAMGGCQDTRDITKSYKKARKKYRRSFL